MSSWQEVFLQVGVRLLPSWVIWSSHRSWEKGVLPLLVIAERWLLKRYPRKLVKGLFSFKNICMHIRERTQPFSKVNTQKNGGRNGGRRQSLPLFSIGRIRPCIFNLYLPLLSILGKHLLVCTKENVEKKPIYCLSAWIYMQKSKLMIIIMLICREKIK